MKASLKVGQELLKCAGIVEAGQGLDKVWQAGLAWNREQ